MPSLKEFVEALQAGWFPALAALVGCSIVVLGDWYSLPYISVSPRWVLTTAVVVGVFAFSILAANAAYLPVYFWKSHARRRARLASLERMKKEVDSVPLEEQAILQYLSTTGKKAFVAEMNHPLLAPLIAKGIIKILSGTHSILEWPHIVQDDVWEYMLSD